MGWWSTWKSRRAADKALKLAQSGRAEAARELLAASSGGSDSLPYQLAALRLHGAGNAELALWAIEEALRLDPKGRAAGLLRAEIEASSGRLELAAGHYAELCRLYPWDSVCAQNLASVLLELKRPEAAAEAILPFRERPEPEVRLAVAQVLYACGRLAEALPILAALLRAQERQLRSSRGFMERRAIQDEMNDVRALHDEVYSAMNGREALVLRSARAGQLDARAGVNYKLIGESLMTKPPAWKPEPTLRGVSEGAEYGQALLRQGQASRGHCHLGLSALREGDLRTAQSHFEQARKLDGSNFAAWLGLGAVLDARRDGSFRRILELPEPEDLPELAAVVPELPVLTEPELRVVHASVRPLRGVLGALRRRGATARLLPIDALLIDLPEFAAGSGDRSSDHRCIDAITGAATPKLAASKIEDLHDIESEGGWVFAHELAHLAHRCLPASLQLEILRLHQRALRAGYVCTGYQLKNDREFFAVSYTDFLRWRHGLALHKEMDEDGLLESIFDFFERIEALGELEPDARGSEILASGAWSGFYELDAGQRQEMRLELAFEAGAIRGQGTDPVGSFSIEGGYDADGRVSWKKRYAEAHAVLYQGLCGEGGISGLWSIGAQAGGSFELRPGS